jgi:prepilin-type processing-associated H-X9-DG protein
MSVIRVEQKRGFVFRLHFTMIELMIVIALIIILASMLLPALNKARNTAKGIMCVNNLKQLSVCFEYYASDFDEWCCSGNLSGVYWCYYFKDNYPVKPANFYCPSSSVQSATVDRYNISYGLKYRTFGYYLSSGASGQLFAHKKGEISKFGRDSTLIVFADSCPLNEKNNFEKAAGAEGSLIEGWWNVDPFVSGSLCYAVSTRRHNGANCLFFDGHISKLSPVEAQDSKYYYPIMWNNQGGALVVTPGW